MNLALRVKELRNKKGFSQEILAEEANLSLRTIQRIESNETVPRGDTLKRLAITLNTSPDKIIYWKIQEDQNYLRLMSLSAMWFLVFPLLGIIIPLIKWTQKKDKLKNVNELGIALLNFQISWTILFFIVFIFYLLLVTGTDMLNFISFLILSIPILFLYVYNIIIILVNTIRISKNKSFRYLPSIPFLN